MIERARYLKLSAGRSLILITGLACLANVIAYVLVGPQIVADSQRFLRYSDDIVANGFYVDPFNIWYIGYVILLIPFSGMPHAESAIVTVQAFFSIAACFSVYFAGRSLGKTNSAGIISALLFIGCFELTQWNMYVLSDSLFTSLSAFTFYLIVRQKRSTLIESLTVAFATITFLIKPAGVVLLLATGAYYLARMTVSQKTKWTIASASLILIMWLANTMLTNFELIKTYQTGDIVYECRNTANCPSYFRLDTTALESIEETGIPFIDVAKFAIANPVYFSKLTLGKLIVYVAHAKPYYSVWHNLFVLLVLIPSYFFFWRGLKPAKNQIKIFAWVYALGNVLMVMLTTEDWDGRFLMPVLPLLFIFAGPELEQLYRKSKGQKEKLPALNS